MLSVSPHSDIVKEKKTSTWLQGHVVAEQQLQIPQSWLQELDPPTSLPAPKPATEGKLSVTGGGSERVSVQGPNHLSVEVPLPFLRLLTLPLHTKKNPPPPFTLPCYQRQSCLHQRRL